MLDNLLKSMVLFSVVVVDGVFLVDDIDFGGGEPVLVMLLLLSCTIRAMIPTIIMTTTSRNSDATVCALQ